MTAPLPPLLLVGHGNMGRALLAGWGARGIGRVVVVDPAGAADAPPGVTAVAGPGAVPAGFRPAAIVFAIKPQQAAAALPAYAAMARDALCVSILAGCDTAGLRRVLGPDAAVVRAMPNMPAAIGQGMTVAWATPGLSDDRRGLAADLLSAVGEFAWVDDESLIDTATAVSGSGPAYVYLLAELMEQGALAQGVPAGLARLLARRTVAGAGGMLAELPDDAGALRRAVTSPGGTTHAALRVLMADDAWPRTVPAALAAGAARARELAGAL